MTTKKNRAIFLKPGFKLDGSPMLKSAQRKEKQDEIQKSFLNYKP